MEPSAQQLAARLNPTPVTITTPNDAGLFRAVGGFGDAVYRLDPSTGQVINYDITGLGRNAIIAENGAKDQYGNYVALNGLNAGSMAERGMRELKDKYGIDYNSLNQFNLADYSSVFGKSGRATQNADGMITNFSKQGDLAELFSYAPAGTGAQSVINGTPNALATPEEIAAQKASPMWNNGGGPVTATTSNYTGPSIVDYLNSLGQASDPASRAKLATEFGITGYTGSAAQNTQLLNSLRLKNAAAGILDAQQITEILQKTAPGSGAVNGIPADISSYLGTSAPSTTSPINLGDLKNSSLDLSGILGVNGKFSTGNTNIDQLLGMIGAPTADSQAYDALNTQLIDAMKQLGNEGTDLQAEYDKQGIPAATNALKQLNIEIAGKKGALEKFDAETIASNSRLEDQAIPTGLIQGQQAQYQKQRDLTKLAMTADLAASVSLAQAYQGNIELGMKLAEDAINLKYAPLENNIKVIQAQLGIAKEKMDKTESKNATIIETLLNMEMERLSDAKAMEKAKQSAIIEAAASGAPASVISQMQNAPDIVTAVSIAGQYAKSEASKAATSTATQKALQEKNAAIMQAAQNGAPVSVIQQMQAAPDALSATVIANKYVKGPGESVGSSGTTGGTGTGTGTTKFTTTQLNSGAAKAGVSVTDFSKLSDDVKNYFINNTSGVKAFSQMLTDLGAGDTTNAEAVAAIDSSNIPQAVKDYLKQTVNTKYPASATTNSGGGIGSFFSNIWGSIKTGASDIINRF